MSKKILITTLVGILIIFSYSTVSFLKIRAYRDNTVEVSKYDSYGALKFPETEEVMEKREKALKELSEAIKEQEEPDETNINDIDNSVSEKSVDRSAERLDFNTLLNINNFKRAWWIKLNANHQPTAIREDVKQLIDKYDGIYLGDVSQKKVYLTFDEGYENGYTPKILDTLKKHGVNAIFFVTGPYIKEHPELVKRMLAEGHKVGNHTIHHPVLPDITVDKLEQELWGLEKQFRETFGTGFKYMRPPRGEYSERVLAASRQLGYKTVFWSFAYMDYDVSNQKGEDYAYEKVMKSLHNGAVILLHAVSKDNADALDRIITEVKAQGYEFCSFDL
jgi:peptidoglycan-N-acetylmuramic acid deacetylase